MDIKNKVNTAAGKLGKFTRTAIKKTGEAAETAKLNIALASEKRKLEKMFSTLGKLFYEQVKGTDVRVQIKAQIFEINEQKNVIASLRADIAASRGKAQCIFCGKPLDLESTYCQHCGKQQFAKAGTSAAHNDEGNESVSQKPLSAEDFVDTFKNITAKYF